MNKKEEERMAALPGLPKTKRPTTGIEAGTWAIAARIRRGKHGQHCPVWTDDATVDRCNCWILRDTRPAAEAAINAYLEYYGDGGMP